MMENIGTRVPTVKNGFSTSKNATLIENKMLQYTTFSNRTQFQSSYILRTRNPYSYIINCPCLSLSTLRRATTVFEPGRYNKIC